jgi:hypothetical protein
LSPYTYAAEFDLSTNEMLWKNRPTSVTQKIDEIFEPISCDFTTPSTWGCYNGISSPEFSQVSLMTVAERILLSAPQEQKDIYIMDIGAGYFPYGWGRALIQHLNKLQTIRSDLKVHMISLCGERFGGEEIVEDGCCARYEFGQFKIEHLHDELEKRGLDLKNKVALIFTHMCLLHLVDPAGAFLQAINLLEPKSGLFFGDNFFFLTEKDTEESFGQDPLAYMISILNDTKAPFLINPKEELRGTGIRYMLKRETNEPLTLPMAYVGVEENPQQCLSQSRYSTRYQYDVHSYNIELPTYQGEPLSGCFLYGHKTLFTWVQENQDSWYKKTPKFIGGIQ